MKPHFLNSIFSLVFHRRETVANEDPREDAIMREKGVNHEDAWNLAKKDPSLKPVREAMRTEG